MISHPVRKTEAMNARVRPCAYVARTSAPWIPAAYLLLAAPAALAQDATRTVFPGTAASPPPTLAESGPFGFFDIWVPWTAFLDGWRILDMALVFLLAAALAAIIAYHPRTREKASTLPELEQPKTFILYALVGAVIAQIVEANNAMALVIFGIGGLMRFRTDVGPAKDTGRVILTAVVGVCCGLKLLVVAVTATAFGWVLLWLLERETFTRLLVKGLPPDAVVPSADFYRRILVQSGCRIFGERKKFVEGQVAFVFAAPDPFDREMLRGAAHALDPREPARRPRLGSLLSQVFFVVISGGRP